MSFDQRRVQVGFLPTPLHSLQSISKESGLSVFIKRDDCTGLAGGGNKTRKLEFLIFDAKSKAESQGKTPIIITAGGVQSNHCRQTVAACAKENIECHLVLTKNVSNREEIYFQTGNFQLDQILGAKIHLIDGVADRNAAMEKIAKQLQENDKNVFPYVVPLGGSSAIGSIGYVNCVKELFEQWKHQYSKLKLDAIYVATSSYGTQAGLTVGSFLFGKEILGYFPEIIGVDVDGSSDSNKIEESVYQLCLQVCEELSCHNVDRTFVKVLCGYGGSGYGQPTDDANSWIIKLARKEGILLDPVYSAKGFSGMMNTEKEGRNIIFIHTGGLPGIFAYPVLSDKNLVEDFVFP